MLRKLTPTERVIAWRLLEGRTVSHDELIEALYSNRADGGPEAPKEVLDIVVPRLRRALAAHGVAIHTVWNRGWNVAQAHIELMRELLADEISRHHRFSASPNPFIDQIERDACREVEERYGICA